MLKFVFLVGRILVDERNFYSFIDSRLLYLLNQFGAKIDNRNYFAIKNDIIKNRKLSNYRVEDLVSQISMVLLPTGYEKMILRFIRPSIEFAKKHLLYLSDDAMTTLAALAKNFRIGIICSNEREFSKIFKGHGMDKYINCSILSFDENNKSDTEIYGRILNMLRIKPSETLHVGDMLDKHVLLANTLGMKSIRICNTMFKLQEPANQNEVPKLTINTLKELAASDYIGGKI